MMADVTKQRLGSFILRDSASHTFFGIENGIVYKFDFRGQKIGMLDDLKIILQVKELAQEKLKLQ